MTINSPLSVIRSVIPSLEGVRILDIGCGAGELAKSLTAEGAEVTVSGRHGAIASFWVYLAILAVVMIVSFAALDPLAGVWVAGLRETPGSRRS